MALSYNLTDIEDYESLWDNGGEHLVEKMVFETIFVGMNSITKENAADFYARAAVFDRLSQYAGNPITPEQVARFIGLKTNASPKTNTQFSNMVVKQALEHERQTFEKSLTPKEEDR